MNSPLLHRFIDLERRAPVKRSAQQRQNDFREVYPAFQEPEASAQAGRCEQCGVPFCQNHCPLHNNIPDWLQLAAEGRLQEAYQLSAATNVLPEVCGRICPQDRLCEGACVLEQSEHESVTIGSVETFLTETAWNNGWIEPIRPMSEHTKHRGSVAIVGSGPSGIAAAVRLRRLGHDVTILERSDRAGGLMIYGIPPFKLDKHVIQRRIDWLLEGGITIQTGMNVGVDVSAEELRAQYDAVLLAVGAQQPREATIAGLPTSRNGEAGVGDAMAFLTRSNRIDLNDPPPADTLHLNAQGKRVTVIGGGDTAMDCVRTAIRQGATSVSCVYRRDRDNMPGSAREVVLAIEEGVTFQWLTLPEKVAVCGDAVESVALRKMRLSHQLDASARALPAPVPGPCAMHATDLLILALGFTCEELPVTLGLPDLEMTRWQTVASSSPGGRTNLDGIFAAGDAVRGPSLVVWALRDGAQSADAIDHYLLNRRTANRDPPDQLQSAVA